MASKKATHCQVVTVPDGVYIGFVIGSKGQNIADLNKKLSGSCVIIDKGKTEFRVEGDSLERVLVGVKELQILIAEKRSYSHRISEWYSLVAAPPLELTPYDCSEFFYFEPKMKSNCTLYSLNMASPGKFGTIPKAAMKNVVELFASHVFDALKEKGRCSWRVKARFGKVLHPVYCKPQFTECNISDIEDDKGFLVDQVPKKFTTEVCGGNSKSFGHSTLNALIPQIDKQREFMEELGRVTVLLIKAVFFNTNGCECEYAILKCIKEEGRGVYQLVEVRKEPKEVTCDCLFLQYCHDIRVAMSVEKEDMRFSDSLRSKAEEIIQAIREQALCAI